MDFHIVFQRGFNPSSFCILRVRYCLFFGIRTGDASRQVWKRGHISAVLDIRGKYHFVRKRIIEIYDFYFHPPHSGGLFTVRVQSDIPLQTVQAICTKLWEKTCELDAKTNDYHCKGVITFRYLAENIMRE